MCGTDDRNSAVGSIFVQIAKKIVGCEKVIGIAGGKEKCDWVKSLGADECVDYKVRILDQFLHRMQQEGIEG